MPHDNSIGMLAQAVFAYKDLCCAISFHKNCDPYLSLPPPSLFKGGWLENFGSETQGGILKGVTDLRYHHF